MITTKLNDLTQQGLANEEFVRQSLTLLETSYRQNALAALAEWQCVGIPSSDLTKALAALKRPAWGAWNGLVDELNKSRLALLRKGDKSVIEKIEQATFLEKFIHIREKRVPQGIIDRLGNSQEHIRYDFGKNCRLKKLAELPIALRNIVVHQSPDEPQWWQWAADTLQILIPFLEQSGFLTENQVKINAPWFIKDDNGTFSFSGLSSSNEAIYLSENQQVKYNKDAGREILEAFKAILGRNDLQISKLQELISKAAPDESRGILLGDFLLQHPVGQGGFATVYKALQLSTSRTVAVKVLKDGMDEDTKLRFRHEAEHLALFNHNENIVDVLNFGEDSWLRPPEINKKDISWYDDFAKGAVTKEYIAMEWVEGRILDEVFAEQKNHNSYSLKKLTELFLQCAKALNAVHTAGLIHRDIKPSNIMLDNDGCIKLMDFGIARKDDSDRTLHTMAGQRLGTPAYMSPEQLRAKDAEAEVTQATDIYSLGAVFYELFTGSRLFNHDSESAVTIQTQKLQAISPVSPEKLNNKLSWEIKTILLGCLAGTVQDRYRSASELERDLERLQKNESITYKSPSPIRKLQLGYRRSKALYQLSALFILMFSVGAYFYIDGIKEQTTLAEKARKDAEEEKAKAIVLRNREAETNKSLSDHIGLISYEILHNSANLKLKTQVNELTLKIKDNLNLRFNKNSMNNSYKNALMCQTISQAILTRHKEITTLKNSPINPQNKDLIHSLYLAKKMEEILRKILKSKEPFTIKPNSIENFRVFIKNMLLPETKLLQGVIYYHLGYFDKSENLLLKFEKETKKLIKNFRDKDIGLLRVLKNNLFHGKSHISHCYRLKNNPEDAKKYWIEAIKVGEEIIKEFPNDDNAKLYLFAQYALGQKLGMINLEEHQDNFIEIYNKLDKKGLLKGLGNI